MGIFQVPKGARTGGVPQESSLPLTNAAPSSPRRRWSNFMPLVVVFVVIAEILLLGRLDIAKNSALVDTWADLFYRSSAPHELPGKMKSSKFLERGPGKKFESGSCEEWLEREDTVPYLRNFEQEPIFVYGRDQVCFSASWNL